MYKSLVLSVIAFALSAPAASAADVNCVPASTNPTVKQLYEAITCLQKAMNIPTSTPGLPDKIGNVEFHTASGGQDLCLRYDYANSHVANLQVTDCKPQNPNQTNTKWTIETK